MQTGIDVGICFFSSTLVVKILQQDGSLNVAVSARLMAL